MKPTKFYVEDCPDKWSVYYWLTTKLPIRRSFALLSAPKDAAGIVEISNKGLFDLSALQKQALSMAEKNGMFPFSAAGERSEQPFYFSQSLVHNPFHIDPEQSVYNSTLGTRRNTMAQYFYSQTENHTQLKNSYYDSYGFCYRTPPSQTGELGKLIDSFPFTMIRSRLSALEPQHYTDEHRAMGSSHPEASRAGWHRDERVVQNLRVNIPVITDNRFLIELEGYKPVTYKKDFIYSWDTNVPHRAIPAPTAQGKRFNLVFGFAPWLKYLPEERAWETNEFFGKVHPLEMLLGGHLHPMIHRKFMNSKEFDKSILPKAA